MSRLRCGLAIVGGLAVVLAGCGSDSETKALSLAPAEQQIAQLAEQNYGDDATVGAVQCPRTVEMRQNNNFTCTVDLSGRPLRISVIQTNDTGKVRFDQAQAVLDPKKLEEVVASYGASHGQTTSAVSCGDTPVLIRSPGKTVECTVTFADGTPGVAKFRVNDTLGNTPLASLEASAG